MTAAECVAVEMNTSDEQHAQPTADLSSDSVRRPIFSRRQLTRMFVALVVGFVGGWSMTALVALSRHTNEDIQDICPGCLLWSMLATMVAANIGCTFTLVHMWYYHHFHNARICPDTNIPIRVVIAIQVGMMAWGGSILFSKCAAVHLRPLLVYTVVYVWIIWEIAIILVMFALSLCVCVVFSGAAL